ncbi:MAG: hypothetical protein BWX45_00464 [Deltaproteobacteria bacterium ADurb.Bin002]|nr:MAG: hypothetical protein BWX45_00464 [Deltaproteobacteria bacterium ADurb.Bin002]
MAEPPAVGVIGTRCVTFVCGNQRVRRGGRKIPGNPADGLGRNIADLRCPLGRIGFRCLGQKLQNRLGLDLPSVDRHGKGAAESRVIAFIDGFGFFLFCGPGQKHPVGCFQMRLLFNVHQSRSVRIFGHEFLVVLFAGHHLINHGQRNGQIRSRLDRVILTGEIVRHGRADRVEHNDLAAVSFSRRPVIEHARFAALGKRVESEPDLVFARVVIITAHMVARGVAAGIKLVRRIGQRQTVDVVVCAETFRPLIAAGAADGLTQAVGVGIARRRHQNFFRFVGFHLGNDFVDRIFRLHDDPAGIHVSSLRLVGPFQRNHQAVRIVHGINKPHALDAKLSVGNGIFRTAFQGQRSFKTGGGVNADHDIIGAVRFAGPCANLRHLLGNAVRHLLLGVIPESPGGPHISEGKSRHRRGDTGGSRQLQKTSSFH